MQKIPDEWIDYIFSKRKEVLVKILRNEATPQGIFLNFTRTLSAIVTHGPAGLNASIKMVGILPKEKFIPELLDKMKQFIKKKPEQKEVVRFLLENIYVKDILDFTKLFTLDLARKNTWKNINETKKAVLLFFTPPVKSFMVKADVSIHINDIIFEFANAMHDLYHVVPQTGDVISRSPTYVFHIKEIWDKSANKFGVKIFP